MAIADPFWSVNLYPAGSFEYIRESSRLSTTIEENYYTDIISERGDLLAAGIPDSFISSYIVNDSGYSYYVRDKTTNIPAPHFGSLRMTFEDPYPNFDSITQINPNAPENRVYNKNKPSGLFKLNFTYEEILPLIWNIKEWDVNFSASCNFKVNSGDPLSDSQIIMSGSMNGKFEQATNYASVEVIGEENWYDYLASNSLDESTPYVSEVYTSDLIANSKAPNPKDRHSYSTGSEQSYTNALFLPKPSISISYQKGGYGATIEDYYGPFNLSSTNTKTIPNGAVSSSVSGYISTYENYGFFGYGSASFGFTVDSVYIKNDGTVDLYFYLGRGGFSSPWFNADNGGIAAAFQVDPIPFSSGSYEATTSSGWEYYSEWGTKGQETVTILGKPLTVYKNYRYEEEGWYYGFSYLQSIDFDFSLSYDIDVSEFWEYE